MVCLIVVEFRWCYPYIRETGQQCFVLKSSLIYFASSSSSGGRCRMKSACTPWISVPVPLSVLVSKLEECFQHSQFSRRSRTNFGERIVSSSIFTFLEFSLVTIRVFEKLRNLNLSMCNNRCKTILTKIFYQFFLGESKKYILTCTIGNKKINIRQFFLLGNVTGIILNYYFKF